MLRQRPNSQVTIGDGTTTYMELNADSVSDLAITFDGVTIAAGSICLVIETGDFYVLDGGGNWVNQTGESTNTNTAQTLIADSRTVKQGINDVTNNEVTEDADILGNIDSDTK